MVVINELPHGGGSPCPHPFAAVTFAEWVFDMGIRMKIAFPASGPIGCILSAFIELFSVRVEQVGDCLFFNEDVDLRFEIRDMFLKGDGDRFLSMDGDHCSVTKASPEPPPLNLRGLESSCPAIDLIQVY